MKNKRGFTLLELAVVVVILAVLCVLGFISYSGAQKKARDSKRASDLNSIASALALYKADNKKYPDFTSSGSEAGCLTKECNNTTIPAGLTKWSYFETNWQSFQTMMANYLSPLPQDPLVGHDSGVADTPYSYIYEPGDTTTTKRASCTNTSCYTLLARPTETSSVESECKVKVADTNNWGSYICLHD